MSYKILLWDALDSIEWSQASWKVEGDESVSPAACDGELIRDVILANVPRDGLIVDVGSGTAKWPLYLRQRGYRCVGVEISRDASRIARRFDPGFGAICSDAKKIPLADASVDAILSLGVVEHDESGPEAQLREIRRILKPSGTLVIAVPFNNLFRRLVINHLQTRVTERRIAAGMKLGFAEYRFARDEFEAILRRTGFEPVSAYPNDLRPPKVMGLWVDFENLVFDPIGHPEHSSPEQFRFRGWKDTLARAALRWAPWLVCGEITVVARPR